MANMKITKELIERYAGCTYDDGGYRGIIAGLDLVVPSCPIIILSEATYNGRENSMEHSYGWSHKVIIFKPWEGLSSIKRLTSFDPKYIAKENKPQPKLKPGMIVVLKSKVNGNSYTCLHISDKWNPTLDNEGFCDLSINHYEIVEIYNLNRRDALNTIDKTPTTLIWKKEDDKKVKLQEKLDALEELYKKAVAEIKAELQECNL